MIDNTILVVDDETEVRKFLARMLRYQGYRVRTTENAQETLELLRGGAHVDLAIVDLLIPEMGGLRLIKRLHVLDPGLRFIVVSGKLISAEEQSEFEALNICFHAKPFRNGEVLRSIENAIRQGTAAACGE